MVRSERDAVRAGLEEQLCTQTAAVSALRHRVTELEGVERKWEMEQERVKVPALSVCVCTLSGLTQQQTDRQCTL